ncbi:MAG: ABC transporter ATP-binding protein [Clostridiales bacterium]|nr:ABC transporter ATP-binding protein [Clostridiales bacterium]
MEKIIEVKNLSKSYGQVHAVNDIDFYVETGKLFAFLGPNGAGKSTTIDILCTLNQADAGEITIAGYDLKTEADLIRQNIGVVFQDSVLDPILTVKENLEIRAAFYYKNKKDIKRAVNKALAAVDAHEFMNRAYGKLSGGQRRRADIARALLNAPKILFLDEPTTGLDPQTRKHVWETIQHLQKENQMTVFLTTHYMEEAADADYIIIIDHGVISAKGTPYELKEQFSSDSLRVKPKSEQELEHYLEEKDLQYRKQNEVYCINVATTLDALPIIEELKSKMESFEVVHGTMDDVFLSVTGKEIRE